MRLHDLRPAEGSRHRRKRLGRGESSGVGAKSGRGTKGLKKRSTVPVGFEGGQMPLQRRLPKLGGFRPRASVEYTVVNVGRIAEMFEAGTVVDPEELRRRGLAHKRLPVKVLGEGEIGKALTVRAHAFSKQARRKIEQAGGTADVNGVAT